MRNEPSLTYLHIPPKIFIPEISIGNLDKMASVYQSLRLFQSDFSQRINEDWLTQYSIFWWFSMSVGGGTIHTQLKM